MAERKGFGRSFGSEWGNIPSMGSVTGSIIRDVLRMGGQAGSAGSGTATTSVVPTEQQARRIERKMDQWRNTQWTPEEIAGNEYLGALKTGLSTLSYEQALANLRAQQKASNQSLLGGTKNTMAAKYKAQQAWAKVNANPLTKYADAIFFAMGGSLQEAPGSKYGGYGMGSVNQDIYNKLGLTAPTTKFAPTQTSTRQVGNRIVTNIANPLNQQQRSRLQRLRTLSSTGTLSTKQKAALSRLKAKKNAPTILP